MGSGRLVIALRVLNAMAIGTYFVPDEFWQHGEAAHWRAFEFGDLTWEWIGSSPIRAALPVAPTVGAWALLRALEVDTPWLVRLVPRAVAGCVAATADVATYRAMLAVLPRDVALARAASASFSLGWFAIYALPRPLANSLETALTAAFVALWATAGLPTSPLPFVLAALAVAVRPTAAVFIAAFAALELVAWISRHRRAASFERTLVAFGSAALSGAVFGGTIALLADSWWYGRPTLTAWNFVRFNVLSGGSALFGEHPWHWYLTQGLPAVLGPMALLLPVGLAAMVAGRQGDALSDDASRWSPAHSALAASACYAAAHSFIPHKEFRFLLPLLPWLALPVALGARALSFGTLRRPAKGAARSTTGGAAVAVLSLANLGLAGYTSLVHQRGPIAAAAYLREQAALGTLRRADFLMPCHSAPLYSEVHTKVPLLTLDCSPDALAAGNATSRLLDSAPAQLAACLYLTHECSYRLPLGLEAEVAREGLPSHVLVLSGHAPAVAPTLARIGLSNTTTLFNTHVSGDGDAVESHSHIVVFTARDAGQAIPTTGAADPEAARTAPVGNAAAAAARDEL